MRHAHDVLLANEHDRTRVNKVLTALAAELAPARPILQVLADIQPIGPIAEVLEHLRSAFTHAAASRTEQAVTAVVTANATSFGAPRL